MTESSPAYALAQPGIEGVGSMIDEDDMRAYARAFHGRFHAFAAPYARSHAEKLADCGDRDGAAVWRRVAELVEKRDLLDSAA